MPTDGAGSAAAAPTTPLPILSNLRHSERIITELRRRYGHQPAVWGWQLHNEPSARPDYSPSAQQTLQEWQQARYQTIDVLNREWGTAFWGLKYNRFDQIRIFNVTFLYGPNPHAVLHFHRFTTDQTARFLNCQAGMLRRQTVPPVHYDELHINDGGAARRSTDLDSASFTIYPLNGRRNPGEDGFWLGWHQGVAFASPFYRNVRGAKCHGAAAGLGELGLGEPASDAGSGADVVLGRLCRQLLLRLHLPFPPARVGPRAIPLWHCGHRWSQSLAGRTGMPARRARDTIDAVPIRPAATPSSDPARKIAILRNDENLRNLEQRKQTAR